MASGANGPDKFEGRRVEILKTAAAAFRRRGYHGASVDEIAGALAMTKGNLYYYFRNKEDILYACHDYSLNLILGVMDEIRREAIPADEKLRRLIAAFVHLIIDELHSTALTLDLQALSPPLLKKVIARRDRFDRGLRAIIQEGIDEGLFAPADAKLVSFAIMGAVNWIPKWFNPEGSASSDEVGRTFADFLVGGLRRGPVSAAPRPDSRSSSALALPSRP
ncbi:MAG: TetR/AcrR family transcriptional regulator [Vicinamibacterales bacterium]